MILNNQLNIIMLHDQDRIEKKIQHMSDREFPFFLNTIYNEQSKTIFFFVYASKNMLFFFLSLK
jgi:hypothetical protein